MARTPVVEKFSETSLLNDGTEIITRMLEAGDKIVLLRFFERIPEEDRFYLKENVTSPEVIRGWTEKADPERALAIVADASLHRSRSQARRHIAEVRIVVDLQYRQKGLGTMLLDKLVGIATDLGLEKVTFELVDRREDAATKMGQEAGFSTAAILPGRVKDLYGGSQDLVVLEKGLRGKEGEEG